MNKPVKRRTMIRNIILFSLIIAATLFIVLRGQRPGDIIAALKTIKIPFVIVALGCMVVFTLCEAFNIKRCLSMIGDKTSFFGAVKYALTGFFFSSVTPSSTGGQPMQVYYMYRDNISPSHSALALLIEFSSFQTITVLYAVVGLITQYSRLSESIASLKYFFVLGVLINCFVLFVVLTCIFSKRLSAFLVRLVYKILKLLHIKSADRINEKLSVHLLEYQKSSQCIKNNKIMLLKTLLTTALQMTALHSIPYFIYLSFGLSEYSMWTVISMQAVLYITVSIMPLPGASGASEGGFMLIYRSLFTEGILSSAMLISRSVSFYLPVIITGIFIAVCYVYESKTRVVGKALGANNI